MIGGNGQSCVEEEAEVYKTISTINPAVVTSYYRQFFDLPLWTAVLQSVLYQLMLSITIDLLPQVFQFQLEHAEKSSKISNTHSKGSFVHALMWSTWFK